MIIGVIADTHIPDRAATLHPGVLEIFKERKVGLILHAGDLCNRDVLIELEEIAEVKAVRGNRDFLIKPQLPMVQHLDISGIKILLAHGHANLRHYLIDKVDHSLLGYRLGRYENYFTENHPQYQVYVFGHSHAAENRWMNGRLFFNPGSASVAWRKDLPPSIGILEIRSGGQIKSEIIPLRGWTLHRRSWSTEAIDS